MVDPGPDFGRAYASQVLLDPEILGTDNVQDALTTIGGIAVQTGDLADTVEADSSTTVHSDGAPHAVACDIAAPPAWMDSAGNITAAGVYAYALSVAAGAAATTPGTFVIVEAPRFGAQYVPVDALALGPAVVGATFALGAADLPFSAAGSITGQTDATATVVATPDIQRIVAPA